MTRRSYHVHLRTVTSEVVGMMDPNSRYGFDPDEYREFDSAGKQQIARFISACGMTIVDDREHRSADLITRTADGRTIRIECEVRRDDVWEKVWGGTYHTINEPARRGENGSEPDWIVATSATPSGRFMRIRMEDVTCCPVQGMRCSNKPDGFMDPMFRVPRHRYQYIVWDGSGSPQVIPDPGSAEGEIPA